MLSDGEAEPFEYDSIASLDSQDFSDYSDFGDREDHKAALTLNVVRKPAHEISRRNAGSQTQEKDSQSLGARILQGFFDQI